MDYLRKVESTHGNLTGYVIAPRWLSPADLALWSSNQRQQAIALAAVAAADVDAESADSETVSDVERDLVVLAYAPLIKEWALDLHLIDDDGTSITMAVDEAQVYEWGNNLPVSIAMLLVDAVSPAVQNHFLAQRAPSLNGSTEPASQALI